MSGSPALIPFSNRVDPAFARDVAWGLTQTQKTLPPRWFYDAIGSALFETITLLPEYGLTRADAALLESHAGDIVRAAGEPGVVIELGSGTGSKTKYILCAAARRRALDYFPIDVSAAALESCAQTLSAIQNLAVHPMEGDYMDGVGRAMELRRPGERALLMFLGSTIGNFSRLEAVGFLDRVRRAVHPGDVLLLGTDLVKPRQKLIEAYDDPTGVTAAFNRNVLARINRELGGEFDLARFRHVARWNRECSRIEMHLSSRTAQNVKIAEIELNVDFARGETIWTESSHKFRTKDISALAEQAGWRVTGQWIDREWGFAETLLSTN